jgi:hypothetical protein
MPLLQGGRIEVIAMQEVEKVLGHEEVIRHLQNAVAMDQVSHSYIPGGQNHVSVFYTSCGLHNYMVAGFYLQILWRKIIDFSHIPESDSNHSCHFSSP